MVTKEDFEQEMYDLIICKLETESDGWQSTYTFTELNKALVQAYNLAIERAAEKAQVAVYQRGRDISTWEFKENEQEVMATFDDMGDSELYKVSKESILNLKIKE